ncbi:MAG: UbiA family prenyltransferase [Bacteroidetes bacterium]|nr:UbiA family prenyltransferase [Bacteroidota bacterium]
MLTPRDIGYLWRLSRPLNLGIGALTFGLSAYISGLHSWGFLQDALFWAELTLLVGIMAGGYWINDVYDRRIDLVNKPGKTLISTHISAKKVLTCYWVAFLVLGTASLFLPLKFLLLNLGALMALHTYARVLKRRAILGNVLIAILAGLVVLAGALLYHLKLALLWGIGFAILTTLIREIVKDVEDMRGDMQHGLRTFPILMGISASKRLLGIFYTLLLAACLAPLPLHYRLNGIWLWPYLLYHTLGVIPLIVWARIRLSWARQPHDFGKQSQLLKLIMLLGLFSLLLLPIA